MEQILINYTKNEESNNFMLCINGLGRTKVFSTESKEAQAIVDVLKNIIKDIE